MRKHTTTKSEQSNGAGATDGRIQHADKILRARAESSYRNEGMFVDVAQKQARAADLYLSIWKNRKYLSGVACRMKLGEAG